MLYDQLQTLSRRPAPFSRYTTDKLWRDPHIARQMLRFHLDPAVDAASRKAATIAATVAWLDRRFQLSGKRVLDLGCGPGLYATRMAAAGAEVAGVDFSPVSIAHARQTAPHGVRLTYLEADYLADPLPGPADLVTLIYGDYCALSPARRAQLLGRIAGLLAPGGRLVFDVYSPGQMAELSEGIVFGERLMGGFFAEEPYFGFRRTWLYRAEEVSLEHYLIAGARRTFEIFNWMQYFTPDRIADELADTGFRAEAFLEVETGAPWDGGATPFFVAAVGAGG